MFPFSQAALRDKVLDNLKKKDKGNDYGWGVYTVDQDGSMKYTSGYANKYPIPGKIVEYWVAPDEYDWIVILNGLIRACEKSGMIDVY